MLIKPSFENIALLCLNKQINNQNHKHSNGLDRNTFQNSKCIGSVLYIFSGNKDINGFEDVSFLIKHY